VLLHADTMRTFTLAAFDSLGMGALIAFVASTDATGARLRWWLDRVALPVGAGGMLMLLIVRYYAGATARWAIADFVLGETALSLVLGWIVGSASRGFTGVAGRLLAWGPVTYVGKISYGIYLFHAFVPGMLRAVAPRVGVDYRAYPGGMTFVVVSTVTIALAAISWQLFERPLNELKRHFPYRDGSR
jgi:peptidoglycan/LPS O-acetylase OafA/YrhL